MKKLLALFLVAVMLFSTMSFVFAEEGISEPEEPIVETEAPEETAAPEENSEPVEEEPVETEAPEETEALIEEEPAETEAPEETEALIEEEPAETEALVEEEPAEETPVEDPAEELEQNEDADALEEEEEPVEENELDEEEPEEDAEVRGIAGLPAIDKELMAIDVPVQERETNGNGQDYKIHFYPMSSFYFIRGGVHENEYPYSFDYFIRFRNGNITSWKCPIGYRFLELRACGSFPSEMPLLGGVFKETHENKKFFVYGTNNTSENDNAAVICVARYNRELDVKEQVKTYTVQEIYELSGFKTYEPFKYGTVRASFDDENMYLYTCHTTYPAVNGEYQQTNLLLVIRMSDLKLLDAVSGTVSHSFNQFVLADNEQIVTVDHADAMPRAIVLNRYTMGDKLELKDTINLFEIGGSDTNETGCSIGGFCEYGDEYLLVGNSVEQTAEPNYDGQRNVFMQRINKRTLEFTTTWLTDYSEGDNVDVSTPQVGARVHDDDQNNVVLEPNGYAVIWTEDGIAMYNNWDNRGNCWEKRNKQLCTSHSVTDEIDFEVSYGMLSDGDPGTDRNTALFWYVDMPGTTSDIPFLAYYLCNSKSNATSALRAEHKLVDPEYHFVSYPTMTEWGQEAYKCNVCGYTEVYDKYPSFESVENGATCSGAEWGSAWIYVTESVPCTCTTEGYKHKHLIYNFRNIDTGEETILYEREWDVVEPPYGHSYQADGICWRCGHKQGDPEDEPVNPPEPPVDEDTGFTDVRKDAYYYDAVKWAVQHEVTNGTSDTTFSPDATCTRGQIVTFLWRAAGKPEPASTENPFVDVSEDAYYYKAVLWAAAKGVTSGTSETTFSPDAKCTRAQIVTFLWRNHGEPGGTEVAFTDVPQDAYYAKAVAWAVKAGITKGTSETTFSPDNVCNRAQAVTFIYRYLG